MKAAASAWGWSWIASDDRTLALYINCGIAERYRGTPTAEKTPRQTLAPGIVAYRCLCCGYTEASLTEPQATAHIPPRPMLCIACKEDTAALHALELQEAWGINLGWRRPPSIGESEFYTRRERLREMGRNMDDSSGMGKKQPNRKIVKHFA